MSPGPQKSFHNMVLYPNISRPQGDTEISFTSLKSVDIFYKNVNTQAERLKFSTTVHRTR
jgi:hypothetical protein